MNQAGPIRVLIVDDSSTCRSLLSGLCEAEPGLRVVGEAQHGHEAMPQAALLRPQVVVMDIEMPHLDGISAARAIMARTPTSILVVTAAHEVHDLELALRVNRAGGLRVITKPIGPASPGFREQSRRFVLLVKALAGVHPIRRPETPVPGVPADRGLLRHRPVRPQVVGVAASTGGPAALQRFLAALPPEFDVPMLVVQHTSEGSAQSLVGWLSAGTPRPVKLAVDEERLTAGTVYVAPGGQHLRVVPAGRARLSNEDPVAGYRPSATVLFSSMAQAYGARAAGVVLTGMGCDGLDGARALRAAGAVVLAQDLESSAVYGMPGAVTQAGLAMRTGPVQQLATWLASPMEGA